jgi:hypothetical protein
MRKNCSCLLFIMIVISSSAAWALPVLDTPERMDSGAADGSYTIAQEAKDDEVKVLEAKEISLLSDDKLVEAYIDAMVEIEGAKVFHSTSGFTPKEYKKYKGILKYRMQLLFEIYRRKIAIPAEVK